MNFISDKHAYTSRNHLRAQVTVFFLIIVVAGWIFPTPQWVAFADDTVPSLSVENGEPVFPPITLDRQPDNTPPLYPVPFALNPHDHFYFTRPLNLNTNSAPSPDFRYGYYYTNDNSAHTGVDITSPVDTPVLTAGDGVVVFAGYGLLNGNEDKNDPYGKAVMIQHNFSYQNKLLYTVYAHLNRIDVEEDQIVKMGEQIGTIGMTGNTTGPHVHFEVRVKDEDGSRVQNPELWMAPSVDSGVLTGRIQSDFGHLLPTQEITLKSLATEQTYTVLTYAALESIHSDDYFDENFVIGDLPAGDYEISIYYKNKWFRQTITIIPGSVNYLTFLGKNGFTYGVLPVPDEQDFLR